MFSSKTDESMYQHAKMGRIQDLKKKLYALIAKGGSEPDGMEMPQLEEDSPEDDHMDELAGGEDVEGHSKESELAKLRREMFKPKPKFRRPGTAMMIAVAKPQGPKDRHPYGGKGKSKGKMA